jgi:hypothetical protein
MICQPLLSCHFIHHLSPENNFPAQSTLFLGKGGLQLGHLLTSEAEAS